MLTKREVAENKNTPIEVLVELSKDDFNFVRKSIAENVNIPSDILNKLSDDVDESVRSLIVKNPNTTSETLNKLSEHEYNVVRENVANAKVFPGIDEFSIVRSKECKSFFR